MFNPDSNTIELFSPDLHTGVEMVEDVVVFQNTVTVVIEIHTNLQHMWQAQLYNHLQVKNIQDFLMLNVNLVSLPVSQFFQSQFRNCFQQP